MKLLMRKVDGHLVPCYDSDRDLLNKAPEEVQCDIKIPRNLRFHKKYFALLNMAFANQELTSDFNLFRKAVTIEAGFTEEAPRIGGEIVIEAKSVSFGSMPQEEFDLLYQRTIDVIINLLECSEEDINNNLINFM